MHKMRFLCATHRAWLKDNPLAANSLWLRSQQRGQELAEEQDYLDAARHAGAAFETAGILLGRPARPGALDIRRFTESCTLLVDMLQRLGEHDGARNMAAAAIARMEQLLLRGVERTAVLDACQRLLQAGQTAVPGASGNMAYRGAAPLH
ncbi:hypothetical protein [Haliea sp. E17]|uniref:hypothetical protein n=1 Tax=Haliea sp. E17 TaxID=3401576 RepID=UPI003AB080C8